MVQRDEWAGNGAESRKRTVFPYRQKPNVSELLRRGLEARVGVDKKKSQAFDGRVDNITIK